MKVPLNKIMPRHKVLEVDKVLSFMKKCPELPIKLCYAKDLNKYIIVDGHNRYYAHLFMKKKKILAEVDREQKTEFTKYDMPKLENYNGSHNR